MVALFIFLAALAARADEFWWGAGHAAFQVEGEPGDSDWREWTRAKGNVADGSSAERATGFWAEPAKDLDLARDLGANMFRISLAWDRIEPERGRWDEAALERYERIIVDMRRRGLEPLVTLQHFVLPRWLAQEGGLLSPTFADDFARFAVHAVSRLAVPPAKVRWWMTFNEPMVQVYGGYVTAEWPPQKQDQGAAVRAAAALAKAHMLAVTRLRDPKRAPLDLKISVAAHWRDFQGEGWLTDFLAKAADEAFNRQFLRAITTGHLAFRLPFASVREDVPLPAGVPMLDYLGINYYGRTMIGLTWRPPFLTVGEGPGPKSEIGWEIYPEGLGHVLKDAHQLTRLPILISENGVADAEDRLRSEFLRSHLREIARARREGVPVIGYLHWALTDNFEWARGFAPRFGLVAFDSVTGERRPRPSFSLFRDLIRRGIDHLENMSSERASQ